ncbi:general secretion pathway protein H [Pseudomonas sp. 2848]|nr:general secretion pathway protein H [Pseudomonas sp. 2848]
MGAGLPRDGNVGHATAIAGQARSHAVPIQQRGFSLLELLVVLAIAALMTSLAVAWLDSGRSSIDQALDRLAAATVAQADLARHAGQLRGLRWNGQRPEFVRRQGEHWQVETVALGDWPKGLRPDWPVSQAPALLFTPDGWSRPGTVRWRWAEGGQRWDWDRGGQLRVSAMP